VTVVKFETTVQVVWKVFRSDTGEWVAICDSLGLTAMGDTWSELGESINQTLNLMMIDLIETGEFDRFLRDRGWRLLTAPPAKPKKVRFDIPYTFEMETEAGRHQLSHR